MKSFFYKRLRLPDLGRRLQHHDLCSSLPIGIPVFPVDIRKPHIASQPQKKPVITVTEMAVITDTKTGASAPLAVVLAQAAATGKIVTHSHNQGIGIADFNLSANPQDKSGRVDLYLRSRCLPQVLGNSRID